ncbi:ubiquitin-protein ligase [Lithospermum erythrorhizon]|uniref:Ubiquitin-protein ligase n=1 Tax=Lithospermum erythrorhizon TaxID=34254 RepID=A0AAV3PXQ8_LITER
MPKNCSDSVHVCIYCLFSQLNEESVKSQAFEKRLNDKLAYFRMKELKDILTQLGLSKQGKKQDLIDKISAILVDERVSALWAKKNAVGKEEVAKLVHDIYRKMQVPGVSDLASKSQAISDSSSVKLEEEIVDSYQVKKVHCLCGSSLQTDSMIKCEDSKCSVWQHINCVIIPEKPMEAVRPVRPDSFYCELCRLSRADPFCVSVGHPLSPAKLSITSVPADCSNPVQRIEKNFQLVRADKDLLMKQEYDLQAWCMLLNDKVPFRMQWPQYADMQVNGVPVRAINRPGSQLLGANGRDDGPIITTCTKDGINRISLTGCDARTFCLGVRIINRHTVQQILNIIPKEAEGEQFDDALARVRRCIGGGDATENADSDSDLEVVADFIPVNLRCPMSGSRIKVAGRFKPCIHMGCFDLDVFVAMNQRSRKWQCPICLKNYSLEHIIVDPYFNRITSKLQHCAEDITEIEVKPDGSWRAKREEDRRDLGEIGMWHLPNGSLCLPTEVESKPNPEVLQHIKQEDGAERYAALKLGMKKNQNGFWEIRQPADDAHRLSSGNMLSDNFRNQCQNAIPMGSSATGSGFNGDDHSVNQDAGGSIDFSMNNGVDFDSISLNINSAYAFAGQNPSPTHVEAEVIVLSDSDEDPEPAISAGVVYNNNWNECSGIQLSGPTHGTSGSCHEDIDVGGAGGSSGLDLFDVNDEDSGMDMWTFPTTSQCGPNFPLFGPDVSTMFNVHHGSVDCSTSMNSYPTTTGTVMDSIPFASNSSAEHPCGDVNGGLVDNPLAFGSNDSSLQMFFPPRPSTLSAQEDLLIDQADVSNGVPNADWISLSLAGTGSDGANGIKVGTQLPSNEGALDSLADNDSLLLGLNDNRSLKRSDGPFQFPRQRRSVRPRLYL